MNITKENEQWKSRGECDKCRRQKYCSHDCTQKKRIARQEEMDRQRKMYEALMESIKKKQEENAAKKAEAEEETPATEPAYSDEECVVE